MRPKDLLLPDERGLFCPAGGFHIDPWRPCPIAIITHAHSDHARAGSDEYWCAEEGAELLAARLPAGAKIKTLKFGEKRTFGETFVSLHAAGHVRGSAQVRVERGGEVWVFSGDYKRQDDPTCAPFEIVPCGTFISEATFALPVYRWEATHTVICEIARWWKSNAEAGRASVLFCYSLGKTQRILAELHRLGHSDVEEFAWLRDQPVILHGASAPLVEAYRRAHVVMQPTVTMDDALPARARSRRAEGSEDVRALVGGLAIAPPSAAGSAWMRRFGGDDAFETAMASGWMRVRGVRTRRGYDRGFVLSDHADWPGLIGTIRATGAKRVLTTHGATQTLADYLRGVGIEASPLKTAFGDGDDD